MIAHGVAQRLGKEVREVKKAVVVILALTLLTILPMVALVQADALIEKNNDKFETFAVTGKFPFSEIALAEHQYVPSKENVNLLVITYEETFSSMEIDIGSDTYKMGTDFAYEGQAKYVFHDVTAWLVISGLLPAYLWPSTGGYRSNMLTVDYKFDFSAFQGGLEGTLNMMAVNGHINSLSGTGDLQNVQIKGEILPSTGFPIITIHHEGIVSGWPE